MSTYTFAKTVMVWMETEGRPMAAHLHEVIAQKHGLERGDTVPFNSVMEVLADNSRHMIALLNAEIEEARNANKH